MKTPTDNIDHSQETQKNHNIWAHPSRTIYQAPSLEQSPIERSPQQDIPSHDDTSSGHDDMEINTATANDDMEAKVVNDQTSAKIVYHVDEDDPLVEYTDHQDVNPSSLALTHSKNLLLQRIETKANELEYEVTHNTDTLTHVVGHVYDMESMVQQRVTDVGQNLHQLFIANQEAALKVQLGIGDLSTKQDLYKTEGIQWWTDTIKTLDEVRAEIIEDRAATNISLNKMDQRITQLAHNQMELTQTQTQKEIRPSLKNVEMMLERFLQTVSQGSIPQTVEIKPEIANSINALTTTVTEDHNQVTLMLTSIAKNQEEHLTSLRLQQEGLMTAITAIGNNMLTVTQTMAANTQDSVNQMLAATNNLASETYESVHTLTEAVKADHIHTREMLTKMSECFKEVGITYRPILQLSPPTSPDRSKLPHVVTTPKRKKRTLNMKAYRQQTWTQQTLNVISIPQGTPLALNSTPNTIQTALALPQPSTLTYPSHLPQPEASLVNQEPIMGTLGTAHEHLIPISTITDYISLAAGMSAEEL